MDGLKPENIIKNLCDTIKPEEFEEHVTRDGNLEESLLIPIKDVINRAIEMHDEITIIAGIKGLESLFERTKELILDKYPHYVNNNMDIHRYTEISGHFKEDLTAIGLACGDKKLNLAIKSVADSLGRMGEIIASGGKSTGDLADEKFAVNLAEKLWEMDDVYKESGFEGFIDRIFKDNEREKTFGFFIEDTTSIFKERKMTDDEFNAFKQFKKHYKEDVAI